MYPSIFLYLVAFFCLLPVASEAADKFPFTIKGPAIVLDGDTFEINKQRVRLSAVSAPEMKEPRGPFARAAMDEIIGGREVSCEISGTGKYKRLIGVCSINGQDIGAELIRQGYAFVYRTYAEDRLEEYNDAEREAITKGLGFWKKQNGCG